MSAALEAYQRLQTAQRERPDPSDMKRWQDEIDRANESANIRRRLPKVA